MAVWQCYNIIDLKNNKFSATDVEVNIHKNVFGNITNDPRIISVSAKGDSNKTLLNKGIFTSCNTYYSSLSFLRTYS